MQERKKMVIHEFGNPLADIVLIQPVDGHDLAMMDNEIKTIAQNTADAFRLIAVEVDNWNFDLSPWRAPAVFGNETFGNGAENTLANVTKLCEDKSKTYLIGGYSLAGLFAIWAAYQTDLFKSVAAASSSVWFPGFLDYMKGHEIQSRNVYLSLGDKEEKTRNQVMATVGERIQESYRWLSDQGITCSLEWNEGNHFKDADIRTAKAFSWAIHQL